ncbi:hypothetical protein, partial [Gilvibacter sp.]|uniref:hypothetical protein n=1 Tax=Gilvibacter sp. TaxID=2729997 RepID=UPI003F4A16BE
MIKRLLLLGFLLSSFHFFGQCPTGDITLASQADVDNFAVLYPGCTELNVKLSIGGPLSEDDITDLSPLSGLTKILGDDSGLNITNCSLLTSLEGLNNLTEVSVQVLIFNTGVVNVDALTNLTTAGALRVDENDAIENLDGFQNVTTVVGRISVTDNPVLTSIAGLSGITNVAGGVTINNNPNVPNLSGLENIESAGFVLDINDMDLITNIDELSGLVSASDVFIRNNDALTDITGLSTYTNGGLYFVNNNSLTTISGLTSYVGGPEETLGIDQNDVLANVNLDGITSLKFASFFDNPQLTALPDLSGITIRGFGIGECDLITSFAGLEGLQGIDEFILIQDNPNLEDISALADAEIIGTDLVFNIMGNTSLSECEIASFCAYIDSGGTIDISGNVPGCNSQAEVESVCGGCPPGSVVLTTQAEVDNFAVMYPGCTTINGSLRIDGPDIVDLTPLASLTTIEDGPFLGNLIIQNCTSLASLDGLNNISLVSAGFSLLQNPLLTDLLGMEGLTSVNSLTIFDNPLLTEITALSNVTGSSGISIGSNNSLLNLNGLEGITSAGIIEVFDNAVMTSIGGLSGLTDAPISISIGSMPSLENFSGLEGLTDLSSAFVQILDCDAIFDLEGLQNLTHLGGLSLVGNGQLNTIGALDGVTFVDPLAFSNIEDNPNLAVCDIVSLCTYFTGGGSFTIANNAPGCNSQAEVEAACAACPTTDVFLTSQAEVDAFFATATACTDLEVGLSIAGADIVDLTPLSGLNSVRTLTIADNPLLTNLSGLETLTTMATDDFGLIIQNNTALEDITALSGLTGTIGFSIVIQDNPALLSLDGLQNITNPSDDDVVIINNDALVNLQGLNSITTTDDMIIRDNDNLLSLDGLDSFSFTGTLEIGNNDQLASLDGLTAFDTLFGLSIYDNAVLTDISGLDSASFDPGFLGLSITNNPLLAVCNTELICGFLVVAGDADATIADNAPGCDSREEVEDSCRVCPTADLVLTSQAEVDAFADTYRFCDNLDVKLTISGADI